MSLTTTHKMVGNSAAGILLLVVSSLLSLSADAYLNRTYSTLEEAQRFDGDFMDILALELSRVSKIRNLP